MMKVCYKYLKKYLDRQVMGSAPEMNRSGCPGAPVKLCEIVWWQGTTVVWKYKSWLSLKFGLRDYVSYLILKNPQRPEFSNICEYCISPSFYLQYMCLKTKSLIWEKVVACGGSGSWKELQSYRYSNTHWSFNMENTQKHWQKCKKRSFFLF